MAEGRHFEKPLYRHNTARVRQIVMKFSTTMHFNLLKPIDGQSLEFFKNPRLRTAAILNTGKSRCLGKGSTDLHKIWYGDEVWPSVCTLSTVKNSFFKYRTSRT